MDWLNKFRLFKRLNKIEFDLSLIASLEHGTRQLLAENEDLRRKVYEHERNLICINKRMHICTVEITQDSVKGFTGKCS